MRVEDYYEDPVVLLHEDGHCFPKAPRAKEIYDVLSHEIRGKR